MVVIDLNGSKMTDYNNSAILAGPLILLGIVMIIETLWPEKWDVDKQN